MTETQRRPNRRFTGTHLTIIAVAALVTLVPGAAIAVTAARTQIVNANGQAADVSEHQLNVRGVVGMSNVVPISNLTIYRANVQIGKPVDGTLFLTSDGQGRAIEIGSMNVSGYTLNGDFEVFLFTRNVALPGACTTNAPNPGPGGNGVLFEGLNPDGASTHNMSWTFPIPLVVEPHTGQRTCLYAWISGYSDADQISIVGAWGLPR